MIVPRWEWRTFGDGFGEADARLDALTPERAEESDEVYLLSLRGEASVKVRGGLMDVKRLEGVNDDGLERWRPILKAEFPLSSADVETVMEALSTVVAPLARESYGFDELISVVVEPSEELLALDVHKRREHYTVGGCMAERSEVRTDRGAEKTIAVESEDAARVLAAVRELGLDSRRNVNMPRGLKALVGFGARRYAVIDVGTNSVKFHIAELSADGSWRTLVDRAEVTRLGEGLDETGQLGEQPIERTIAAVEAMVDEARREGVEAIAAVGTAGLRGAANASAARDALRERTGVEIEVISGEEEARLSYLAVRSGLEVGEGSLAVFDTGGGSTEFTFGRGTRVEAQFSVKVGAARYTDRYALDGVVSEDELATALEAIANDLAVLDDRPSPDAVVGLGGAVTNLAAVKHGLATYDPDVVQGTVLDVREIDRQLELYRSKTAEQRSEIVGLQPKRAEVILAGACIVRTILAKLGSESLTVSDRGLRHALIRERFGAD